MMDEDQDIVDLRIDFLKSLGLTVHDQSFFKEQTKKYGYHEIVWQYLDHYFIDPDSDELKLKHPTDFEDVYALYQLDQKLKNSIMISLQLFEQTFKVALTNEFVVRYTKAKTKLIEAEKFDEEPEIFGKSYKMLDGNVIKRGDLKARIRHIKNNYLEPFEGYTHLHGQIEPWVLIKEMSFGVATNAFFLLGKDSQQRILKRVFKIKLSITDFEKMLSEIKLLRRRGAHNYRLIGIKKDDQFLYKLVLQDLSLLKNQEPSERAAHDLSKICEQYLQKYPDEKEFLCKALFYK